MNADIVIGRKQQTFLLLYQSIMIKTASKYQGFNALIVFDTQTVKGEYKSKVVFVGWGEIKMLKANKETISSTINDIKDFGQKTNIIFKFIVSDGDSATNKLHRDFNKYINDIKGGLNDEFWDYI